MRWASLILVPFLFGFTSGCGKTPTHLTTQMAPTGGSLVRLPRDRGFVALKTESPASSKISRGKNRPLNVVAYFYQTDGTTPMSPAPTDVVFKTGEGEKAKSVTLAPDAADPNRFVSTPGPYPNGLQGTIQAKI